MLVIGSRGSQLALWQANHIRAALESRGVESRIQVIKTAGDKITDVPLAQAGSLAGSKGLFTKEIEEALLDGSIQLAVHSLKDLPTELPPGLTIAATPKRADAYDCVVGKKLRDLPPGSKVGTSSLRRAAQLRRIRPDLRIESVRGNLDTRLRKLDEGQYDAIVLATAGLQRLGLLQRVAERLPEEVMCPAAGQGALAIETQEVGPGFDACAVLDDPWTRFAVNAERALLAALGGGCQVPIGAYARVENMDMKLSAVVCAPDGSKLIRGRAEGSVCVAHEMGRTLARKLLDEGAREILNAVYAKPTDGGL